MIRISSRFLYSLFKLFPYLPRATRVSEAKKEGRRERKTG